MSHYNAQLRQWEIQDACGRWVMVADECAKTLAEAQREAERATGIYQASMGSHGADSGFCVNCGAPVDADRCSYCLTVRNRSRFRYGMAVLRPEMLCRISVA